MPDYSQTFGPLGGIRVWPRVLGTHLKKNYGIIWEFFPFWEPLIQKQNYRLFCTLGP